LGQLSKQIDPDGVTTLYQYDAKGQVVYTALDMNKNSVIDFGGVDHITYTVSDVVNDNSVNVNRTRTYVWPTNNVNISNLVSTVETSVDGLQGWNITWNNGVGLTNYSQTVYGPANGYTIVTAIAPDGSSTVTTNQNGRAISVTQKDFTGAQIGQTIYGYDTLGRQNTATDARNGTTTSFFNADDQGTGTLTPSPDGVQGGQLTTNVLDSMGHVVQTTLPDNTSVTSLYYPNGLLEETYGSRTYPVQYTYDYAGRMKTMTTWTNFATSSGAATTTWNYDPYRGWLAGKVYADGKGPNYYYTPAGRLMNRLWARGILTTYSYDAAGVLNGVAYSDSTPSVVYAFDRLGRQTSVTSGGTVCAWTYNGTSQMLSGSYTGGPLDGLSVTNGYDNLLRRTTLAALSGNSQLLSTTYGYDAASRLSTVSDGTNSAAYTYVANSPLVGQIVFTNGGALRMTTTKQYDYLNRLTQIQSSVSGSPVASFNYGYNPANQRTAVTNADNAYWVYQYDSLGQVISGKKYWNDGTPVAGQQFTYNFDDIGNRTSTASGGDASGANLRSANYTANNLNQYTARDVPGYVDVLGSANSNATVTVNLQRAYRYGNYFRDELAVGNSGSAIWLSLTNLAVLNNGTNADVVASNAGNIFLPQTPEPFGYDADGNLTNDGRFSYTWNGENRLIGMTANVNVGPQYELTFMYDPQGRRIEKTVATNGVPNSTNLFLYDGWNLIAEVAPNDSLMRSYVWGTDLSGSMLGAGGVGGLLEVSYSGTNCFAAYDGNGDVAALVNSADGTVVANYEYGAFGEPIRMTGAMAKVNPIRFSTKYDDDESDLLYYGYRYYKPSTGTWPNRDPLQEQGGLNLYGFVGNDSINDIDPAGEDFIAVGSRNVEFLPGVEHMSIENYEENCPKVEEGRRFNNISEVAPAAPAGYYQLEVDSSHFWHASWSRPKPTAPPEMHMVADRISYIQKLSTATRRIVIYSDKTSGNAKAAWDKIKSAAESYAYAEQDPIGPVLQHWPNSSYRLPWQKPANNSNTFIRKMAHVVGRDADSIGGNHPGALFAQPVPYPGYTPIRH
jgi:RHS repeat-associated protein